MKFNPRSTTGPVTEISDEEFNSIKKNEAPVEIAVTEMIFGKVSPTSAVNARTNPDTKSPSLGVVYPGEVFEVEVFDKDWYKIRSGDKKGAYVRKDFVKAR